LSLILNKSPTVPNNVPNLKVEPSLVPAVTWYWNIWKEERKTFFIVFEWLCWPMSRKLGEMVNLQKVNWPKSQPEHKITKMLSMVGVLASWLFGQLTFWRLTISPSIDEQGCLFPEMELTLVFIPLYPENHAISRTVSVLNLT